EAGLWLWLRRMRVGEKVPPPMVRMGHAEARCASCECGGDRGALTEAHFHGRRATSTNGSCTLLAACWAVPPAAGVSSPSERACQGLSRTPAPPIATYKEGGCQCRRRSRPELVSQPWGWGFSHSRVAVSPNFRLNHTRCTSPCEPHILLSPWERGDMLPGFHGHEQCKAELNDTSPVRLQGGGRS